MGSIPITKRHPTFNYKEKLPILFVDDYSEVTFELLSNYLDNLELKNYNFDILTKGYWKDYIASMKSNNNYSEIIYEKKYITSYFKWKRLYLHKLSSERKKVITFYYKVRRLLRF
jgi:hypothetical protein